MSGIHLNQKRKLSKGNVGTTSASHFLFTHFPTEPHAAQKKDLPEITFAIIFLDFQGHREGEDVAVWSLGGGSG